MLAFAEEGTAVHVLITGVTGVIGARVVPLLLAEGHTVTAVGRRADKRDARRHGRHPPNKWT